VLLVAVGGVPVVCEETTGASEFCCSAVLHKWGPQAWGGGSGVSPRSAGDKGLGFKLGTGDSAFCFRQRCAGGAGLLTSLEASLGGGGVRLELSNFQIPVGVKINKTTARAGASFDLLD
jgi:hypothetical protein